MKNRFLSSAFMPFFVFFAFTFFVQGQDIKSPAGVKHVVMIGYDGLGGQYVHWDELPALTKLRDGGAWTLKKRAVFPSVSAINWATMTMGAGSELHGFRNWGSQSPDLPSSTLTENGLFPDIFYVLRKTYPESKLYCTYNWDGIGYIIDRKSATEEKCVASVDDLMETSFRYLAENPTFAFIYFGEPDGAGHGSGWGSDEYYAAVRDLDTKLAQLIEYLEKNDRFKDTVILFTSDHGGTGNGHGEDIPAHYETPFILYGCGVVPGEITDTVAGYDVAATIAWLLGAEEPQAWRGKAITSAFGK